MKKAILFPIALLLFCAAPAIGQKTLKITLVAHEGGQNDPLVPLFNQLASYIKENDGSFPFSSVTTKQIDYVNESNLVSQATLGTMKAGDFISCRKKLGNDALKPLFIVQKVNQDAPYFSAYLITNKNSTITSPDPEKELTFIFVDRKSVSGYFCPINQLYEMGVIDYPQEESFSKTKWKIEFAGSHSKVASMIEENSNAIGALSELPADMSGFNILLRYDLIPQDVLFVSQDLYRYEGLIRDWFLSHSDSILHTLGKSSAKITGLKKFETEHEMAYQSLRGKIERVRGESKIQTFNFDSPFDVFVSIMKMGWETQALLGTFIASVFTFGVVMARRFPKLLSVLQGKEPEKKVVDKVV